MLDRAVSATLPVPSDPGPLLRPLAWRHPKE